MTNVHDVFIVVYDEGEEDWGARGRIDESGGDFVVSRGGGSSHGGQERVVAGIGMTPVTRGVVVVGDVESGHGGAVSLANSLV